MPNTCSFEPKLDDFLCEKLIYGLVYPSNQNDFIWFHVNFFWHLIASLIILNVISNGMKQDTLNGSRTSDV